MPRTRLRELTPWITAAALAHGDTLVQHLQQRLGLGRRPVQALLRRLAQAQWLHNAGSPRRPRWQPGALREVVQRYPLPGLAEDLPWRRDFAPCFELPPALRRMAQHAFTELLNNAVDHSGGRFVTVSLRQTPWQLQLLVSDDGCGLFQRIAGDFGIDDPALALFELAKGKLTSDPQRHRGHGLFFTARLADVFHIHANASAWQRRAWQPGQWHATRPVSPQGTSVYWATALDTERTLPAVLQTHSAHAGLPSFDRTELPLALLAGDDGVLASRAEARRVAARLSRFESADLDFSGVHDLGQGFADELLRVLAHEQPGLQLRLRHLAEGPAATLAAARSAAGDALHRP